MMAKNPKEALQTYGKNPEFMELMTEFSKIMGSHFEEIGKKKEEEDPIMKIINNDPEVKEILADPKVMKIIQQLQVAGGMDLFEVMRSDPVLGMKFKTLISKGVLNVQSQMP